MIRLLFFRRFFFLPSFFNYNLLATLYYSWSFRPRNLYRLFVILVYFCTFLFMPPNFLICYNNNLRPKALPFNHLINCLFIITWNIILSNHFYESTLILIFPLFRIYSRISSLNLFIVSFSLWLFVKLNALLASSNELSSNRYFNNHLACKKRITESLGCLEIKSLIANYAN